MYSYDITVDFVNLAYVLGVVYIVFNIFKIPHIYYIFCLLHIILVFFLNDFLFPVVYMPDQIRYERAAAAIRETMNFLNYYEYDKKGFGTVSNAALVFSIFPIPYINSVFSIALINSMFFSFIFIFLYRKNILNSNQAIWFYMLYPSYALYSAIGGRDTLIFVFMILSVYQLYRNKVILSLLLASPLLLIKFQNFLIFLLAIIVYKSLDTEQLFSVKSLFKYIIIITGVLGFILFIPIEEINIMRYNMYAEDGGDLKQYIPITGFTDLAITGIIGSIYMLLKPLVWESRNILQLVQAFENIVIFIIIFKLIKKLKYVQNKFKYFLYNYLFISMAIYGIVVFNFGTAARYKYTFIVIFVLFAYKLITDERRNNK